MSLHTSDRVLAGTRSRHRTKGTITPMATDDLPKIGTPAKRALASIGVTSLHQVAERSRAELLELHGLGPRALRILEDTLTERGLRLDA